MAEVDTEPSGFVLFIHNYSTFLCKYVLYIEDLYVREEYRGHGIGKGLLKQVCSLAIERDCGRVEWWCLDWNKPSIDFLYLIRWRVYE
ncbi:MAG: GNAT family N-acetyltransferase [Alphaproteobacteria bacterium]